MSRTSPAPWRQLAWSTPALLLIAVTLALPDGLAPQLLYVLGTTGAAVAAWSGARRACPAARRFLGWIAVGVACSAAADALYLALTLLQGTAPAISLADVGWVAAYLAVITGILQKLRSITSRRSDLDGFVDIAAIAVVVLLLEWELLLGALLGDAALPPVVRGVLSLYPALDAVVLALVARLMVVRRHVGADGLLLAAGAACWFASDLVYATIASADAYSRWVDAGWMLAVVLLAAATWQRTEERPVADDPEADAVGLGRTAIALLPLLVPAAIGVGAHLLDRPHSPLAGGLATFLLVVLAFLRTVRLLDAAAAARALVGSRERQARALAANASDAVLVTDADGRIRWDAPGYAALVGAAGEPTVGRRPSELAELADPTALAAVHARVLAQPGRLLELELRVRSRDDGRELWLGLRCKNLLDDPDVGGIVLNVRDITTRKRAEEALYHQAFHDPLTGLANRALFLDRLEHACGRVPRSGQPPAVVYLDLDGFKDVNDTHGHQEGDELLREVARRLHGAVRAEDTVARLGGDEFAILIERSTRPVDEAQTVAQRILQALGAPVDLPAQQVSVSASVGIAAATPTSTATSLLRDADIAMYRAKATGKARSVVFDQQMLAAALERLTLEGELAGASAAGQLRLVYQPVVDLATERIAGMEALLRWDHPHLGAIAPDRFIPIAEDSGLIVDLGAWVLEEACRTAARWRHAFPHRPPLTMAVNVSARQLGSGELLDQVRRALAVSGLPAACLVLEMTETALIADPGEAAERLVALRETGVRLAIDDFGTGYSSLSYLRQFPVDILKIDRSFIATIAEERHTPAIVRGLLDLGRTLGLETIAEGVELVAQRDQLRAQGCHLAQGYLFARPLDPTDLELLLLQTADRAAPDGTPGAGA